MPGAPATGDGAVCTYREVVTAYELRSAALLYPGQSISHLRKFVRQLSSSTMTRATVTPMLRQTALHAPLVHCWHLLPPTPSAEPPAPLDPPRPVARRRCCLCSLHTLRQSITDSMLVSCPLCGLQPGRDVEILKTSAEPASTDRWPCNQRALAAMSGHACNGRMLHLSPAQVLRTESTVGAPPMISSS